MFLSIDTFSDIFGLSIIRDDKVLAVREYLKLKPFSEMLIPEIQSLFDNLKIEISDLKGVAVNQGIGSNVGLRVGVITAKTLSFSLNIPLYYYRTLDIMIYKYRFFCGDVVAAVNVGNSMVAYKLNNEELTISNYQDFEKHFKKRENTLIVEKNLNLNWSNSINLKTSLSVDGAFFAIKNDLKADMFLFEPLYPV